MNTLYIIAGVCIILIVLILLAVGYARNLGESEGAQQPTKDALHDEERRKRDSAKERSKSDSDWIAGGRSKRKR